MPFRFCLFRTTSPVALFQDCRVMTSCACEPLVCRHLASKVFVPARRVHVPLHPQHSCTCQTEPSVSRSLDVRPDRLPTGPFGSSAGFAGGVAILDPMGVLLSCAAAREPLNRIIMTVNTEIISRTLMQPSSESV